MKVLVIGSAGFNDSHAKSRLIEFCLEWVFQYLYSRHRWVLILRALEEITSVPSDMKGRSRWKMH